MLCENCRQQPATVHLTTIVGGEKTEQHLCASCCQKHKQALTMAGMSTLLLNLLQGSPAPSSENPGPRCEVCGQTFGEFQKSGMLGCPKCYDSFRTQLTPLLTRIHGGARHTGRAPSRTEEQSHIRRRMDQLRREMDRAVADEDFELAARLRDELRAMTPAQDGAGQGRASCGSGSGGSGTCPEGEANA
ncbi:MAG: UvrB/UvrC motif-containing protein [Oscillospiraceae bacterium]|jgi:protein arginine kinase activator|nr:UvrB/UvrC motif-containing protein [Oscillospiraceae bacterium]